MRENETAMGEGSRTDEMRKGERGRERQSGSRSGLELWLRARDGGERRRGREAAHAIPVLCEWLRRRQLPVVFERSLRRGSQAGGAGREGSEGRTFMSLMAALFMALLRPLG